MISQQQNIALLTVGHAALKNPDWKAYAEYCFAREKGMRKAAFAHLDQFLVIAAQWDPESKRAFLQFLLPFCENVQDADYGPFPQPLRDALAKPALMAWCGTEQTDSSPFRWYGKYFRSEAHLRRALEINPGDDQARVCLIDWQISFLYQSLHHLPEVYLGDPAEDLAWGEMTEEQIKLLTQADLRDYYRKELEEDLVLVRNYTAWKASGHPDFEKWGQENNKQTGYGLNRVYYYNNQKPADQAKAGEPGE